MNVTAIFAVARQDEAADASESARIAIRRAYLHGAVVDPKLRHLRVSGQLQLAVWWQEYSALAYKHARIAAGIVDETECVDLDAQAAPAVPEGFVLVPKKPTTAMLDAAAWHGTGYALLSLMRTVYAAMLAAAPKPAVKTTKRTFASLARDVSPTAFPLDTVCETCGERWGAHFGAECPKRAGQTFRPVIDQPIE